MSITPSGKAQVSNLDSVRLICDVPARPFPTKPGEHQEALKIVTKASAIHPDGSKEEVVSQTQPSGWGTDEENREFVDFMVLIPLSAEELDSEVRKTLVVMEKRRAQLSSPPPMLTDQQREQAIRSLKELYPEGRVGHFIVECTVMDTDRIVGVGSVEYEVILKGHVSDTGFLGAAPPV